MIIRKSKKLKLIYVLLAITLVLSACTVSSPSTESPAPTVQPSTNPSEDIDTESTIISGEDIYPGKWEYDANYKLTNEGQLLVITGNKTDFNSYIKLDLEDGTSAANGIVSLTASGDKSVNINLVLVDVDGNKADLYPKEYRTIIPNDKIQLLSYNMSEETNCDLNNLDYLQISINPDTPYFDSTVRLESITIGDLKHDMPYSAAIPDITIGLNSTVKLPIIDMDNDAEIKTYTDNPTLIPEPKLWKDETGTYLLIECAGDTEGTARIEYELLSKEKPYSNNRYFDITVSSNNPPTIDDIEDVDIKSGEITKVHVTGISDGNPEDNQALFVEAVSGDETLLSHPPLEINNSTGSGYIYLYPPVEVMGSVDIAITVEDEYGLKTNTVLTANIYEELNSIPTVSAPTDVYTQPEERVEFEVTATAGDDLRSDLTIEIDDEEAEIRRYSTGRWRIRYTPTESGIIPLTITINDNSGNDTNDGDKSVTATVNVNSGSIKATGFSDDYNDGILDSRLDGAGEGAHELSESGGELVISVDKYLTNNKWSGLWYNFPYGLDLSDNPYVSITARTDKQTPMRIYIWDENDVYNTAGSITYDVDEDANTYTFDFTEYLASSQGGSVDLGAIKALLINFDPGEMYSGTFYFDELQIGDMVTDYAAQPICSINQLANQNLLVNSSQQTIEVFPTIENWESLDANYQPVPKVTVISDNTDLIPTPQYTKLFSGKRALRFTPRYGKTGTANITVNVEFEGAESTTMEFSVHVADNSQPVQVTLDTNTRYQKIDGFGAFVGTGEINQSKQETMFEDTVDIGLSIARFGIIDDEFEPENDNADPYIIDYSSFDKSALPLSWLKNLRENSDIDKYILTVWSPPAWMKVNYSLKAEYDAIDNRLRSEYYEEYAEMFVAVINTVKAETGIDIYAISFQNEPQFNEPYASCVMDATVYAEVYDVIAARMINEGLDTQIFLPEVVTQQKSVGSYVSEINGTENAEYSRIVAIHNYDNDGIRVGNTSISLWEEMYEIAQGDYVRNLWMSETSGYAVNYDGAMNLAGSIYKALYYGNINAWLWWSLDDVAESKFGLFENGDITSRAAVSAQYYSHITPDALRFDVLSDNADLLTLGFINDDFTRTVIAINPTDQPILIELYGDNLPMVWEMWQTQEHENHNYIGLFKKTTYLLPPNSVCTLRSVLVEE